MTIRLRSAVAGAVAAALSGSVSLVMAATPDDALIAKGKYLTTAGDCQACHTGPGMKPFTGGLMMVTPFGTISTPNITPDRETGIGKYTDEQFYRALHEGIDDLGKYLYPAFPFPWYTKVKRDDALAIKAYLFSLAPENAPRKPLNLAFPFNIREALVGWRAAFFKPGTFEPDPHQSDEVNRGGYLVQGLGHCGECHNANNLFGASSAAGVLQGETIQGWYAPNITSDGRQGIGDWSVDQIATFLKTGAAPGHGVVVGPMQQVIETSLSNLTDADLHAIAAYLKSVPPKTTYSDAKLPASDVQSMPGAQVYLSHCATCHQPDGRGISGVVPALAGNGAVLAGGPEDVIRVVLGGLQATHGLAPMPAVGAGMTDGQVADVVNYVRTAWGNGAPANAGGGTVGKLRAETKTLMSTSLPGECPAVDDKRIAQAMDSSGVPDQLKGLNQTNMLERIDAFLPKLKQAAPDASPDALINALTMAYCPVALNDPALSPSERVSQLGNFSSIVYGQLHRQAQQN